TGAHWMPLSWRAIFLLFTNAGWAKSLLFESRLARRTPTFLLLTNAGLAKSLLFESRLSGPTGLLFTKAGLVRSLLFYNGSREPSLLFPSTNPPRM
ncbi:hypothetical protein C8R43DRAFT_976321, partial [Mycena crocata]